MRTAPRDDGVYNMIIEAIFFLFFFFIYILYYALNSSFFSSDIKTQKTTPIQYIIIKVYYLVKRRPAEWFMASDTRFLTRRKQCERQKLNGNDPFSGGFSQFFYQVFSGIASARCELVDGQTRTVSSRYSSRV